MARLNLPRSGLLEPIAQRDWAEQAIFLEINFSIDILCYQRVSVGHARPAP